MMPFVLQDLQSLLPCVVYDLFLYLLLESTGSGLKFSIIQNLRTSQKSWPPGDLKLMLVKQNWCDQAQREVVTRAAS